MAASVLKKPENIAPPTKKKAQPVSIPSQGPKRFATGKQKRAEFSVETDNIWKDVVQHEKLLIKLWSWKWNFLVSTSNNVELPIQPKFPEIFMDKALATRKWKWEDGDVEMFEKESWQPQKKDEIGESLLGESADRDQVRFRKTLRFVDTVTSAGQIGWRLPKKGERNSFDLYPTITRVPKISFVNEQYGVYRKLKYLQVKDQENTKSETETSKPRIVLPSKAIRHKVNPLLC